MNLPRIPVWQIVTALMLLAFAATAGWYYYRISHRIVWTMVHVSGDSQSGDAHLLEFPDGHVVLIDTGFDRYTRSNLIPYLDQQGIDRIDQLVITHAHRNHYGGIKSLLAHLERIDEIYFNLPPRQGCEKEHWSTGCDYDDVLRTRELIGDTSTTALRPMATDDLIYHSRDHDIALEVVFVHDGESEPIGQTGINDTSSVLRLTYGTTTVLFTGDINRKTGKHMLKAHYFVKADIMTAPHHGVDGAASNDFLAQVNPRAFLVSDSEKNWRSERGDRMRGFTYDNNIPTYVTGIHGNVVVILTRDGFEINTERSPPGS